MRKRVISVIMAVFLVLPVFGLSGCLFGDSSRTSGGWRFWYIGNGTVALTELLEESHIIDGVLTIPTHIGRGGAI